MLRLKPDMELSATSDFCSDLLISELSQRIKYGIPNSELAEIVGSWSSYLICNVGFLALVGTASSLTYGHMGRSSGI